jgi:ATP-dependent Lhr-like helicase
MGMTAVFTAAPEFTVLAGRTELGRIDPAILVDEAPGPRRLLLGGRSWQVTYIDWNRRICFVEAAEGGGRARWTGIGVAGLSFELSRAMREVLLGADPPVSLTRRAVDRLAEIRDDDAGLVHRDGSTIVRTPSGDVRWWTWAGYRANATLASTLPGVVDPARGHEDAYLRLRHDLTPTEWRRDIADATQRICLPEVNEKGACRPEIQQRTPTGSR